MKIYLAISFLVLIMLATILYLVFKQPTNKAFPKVTSPPSPQVISKGSSVKVKYPQDYTIVLVGDSMTQALGNSDELRDYLKKHYPQKSFEVLNYGFGSTNILSVSQRLQKETYYGRVFRPILDIDFDLILLESFGHNPLSQYPLEEGLKKQAAALDEIVSLITKDRPQKVLVFVATIAPSQARYGEGSVRLTTEKRVEWANERIAYIKNHLEYARSHRIPAVNIYERSLNSQGDANLDYIDVGNFIHPSPKGVYLISEEIANFIYQNKLLDQ